MTEIYFTPGFPEEIRWAIEPHILKWQHLLPAWCHRVSVLWSEDDNGALSMNTMYDYRRAELTVNPNFLTVPDRREEEVIHELLHVALGPMQNTMDDLKNGLVEKVPELKSWAEEAIRLSNECSVCDLATAILKGPQVTGPLTRHNAASTLSA